MRALVCEAPRRMAMEEQAKPTVQPGEVVIKVAYAGICGSELSGYLGHSTLRVPPLVMGHEFSGEIVALDKEAVRRYPALGEGRWVTVNPLSFCGSCVFCARGLNQLCVDRRLVGAHRPGAFAEFVGVRPSRRSRCRRACRCAWARSPSRWPVGYASGNWLGR